MMLSFVSSFRSLPFLFQFQQRISQFLQDLKSTKEELWSAPKPHEGAQCTRALLVGTALDSGQTTSQMLLQKSKATGATPVTSVGDHRKAEHTCSVDSSSASRQREHHL